MATLRETRDRIRSVNSTKKITKAQELIATSRITKAKQRVAAAQPYANELTDVVARVASATSLDHPLLQQRENSQVAAILVVTSDRGQCGGYNHNVIKKANELEEMLKGQGLEVVRLVTGKKGIGYYDFRDMSIDAAWTGFSENPDWASTHEVRHHLIDGFLAGSAKTVEPRAGVNASEGQTVRGFDQVHVVYTEFVSMLSQVPAVQQLLPVATTIREEEYQRGSVTGRGEVPASEISPDMTFEPDADTLLEALLPKYVSRVLYSLMLESAASESAARRTAMKAATDNANELVRDLTRIANQARQAQITQEITEIIGGAGALADSGESD